MTTLDDLMLMLFVIGFMLSMIASRIGVPVTEIRWTWIIVTILGVIHRVMP